MNVLEKSDRLATQREALQAYLQPLESAAVALMRAKGKRRYTKRGKAYKYLLNKLFTFVSTPFQAFSQGLRIAPLFSTVPLVQHMAAGVWSKAKGNGFSSSYPQALMVRDIADNIIAYGTAALLWGMVEGDDDDDDKPWMLTGSHSRGTESLGERLLNRRGPGPNMLRTPYGTFDYSRYEPLSTALAAMSDLIAGAKRVNRGADPAEEIVKLGTFFLSRIQSQPFLKQTATTAAMIADLFGGEFGAAKKDIGDFLSSVVQGYIPNLVRQPMRNLDDLMRDTDNQPLWKSFLYETFPMSEAWGMQPRINLLGEPVKKQLSGGNQRLVRAAFDTGYQPGPVPAHPVDQFLASYRFAHHRPPTGIAFPSGTKIDSYLNLDDPEADKKGEVKMSPEELRVFREMVGARFASDVVRIISPSDIAAPTDVKLAEINSLYTRLASDARQTLFPVHKGFEKMDRVKRAEYLAQRKLR